jgi:molybdate transport system ATP-binding protein
MSILHYTILIDSKSETKDLANQLQEGTLSGFIDLKEKNGALFSDQQLEYFLYKEEQHGLKIITKETEQSLLTMSSGERKKALLNYLLEGSPEYLVFVNPYDNLDISYQKGLKEKLLDLSNSITLVHIISRTEDILPLNSHFSKLEGNNLIHYKSKEDFLINNPKIKTTFFSHNIPKALKTSAFIGEELVKLKNVSVSYNQKPILLNINWTINTGDFWQLKGPNGSGKSTLLSMITGDNQKAYGQDIKLFGLKKGSGESVWDIKKHIGYFTPTMIDKFRGNHTLENMLISGLHDSIGLYVKPTEIEKKLATQWLQLLNLSAKKGFYFHQLSTSEKRLLMTARAMIKHPPLLLLDEPTAGLDDYDAALFISLINKISKESDTALIFVSHREEKGLLPKSVIELVASKEGSRAILKNN